jgi:serine/threonine protein kinase
VSEEHKGGTLKYSPPELISGKSYDADPRFDIWSLGILLYRLIVGRYPFRGKSHNEIRKWILSGTVEFP